MKKIFCTIALSAMALTAFSQEIKIGRGQVLYHIPSPNIVLSARQHVPYNAVIQTVNIVPAKWKIVKFVNMGNQNTKNYDAMIIQSAGTFKKMEQRTYLLRYQDLSDEHKRIIDDANYKLDSVFVEKQNKIADLAYQIQEIKEASNARFNEYSEKQYKQRDDSIAKFTLKCDTLLLKLKTSLTESSIEAKDSIYNLMSQKEKVLFNTIRITNVTLDTDSAGGNDLCIDYVNQSNKTIKYAYFNCDYYNRVDDKIYCEIRGSKLQRLKETGPVESMKYGGGVWEGVIYNHSASYAVIKSISIIYMDGSTYNVSLTKQEYLRHLATSKVTYELELLISYANHLPLRAAALQQVIRDEDSCGDYSWMVRKHDKRAKYASLIRDIYKTYSDYVKDCNEYCESNIAMYKHDAAEELSLTKYRLENDRTEYEVNVDEDWNYYFVNM